jgi:hypothetical protein
VAEVAASDGERRSLHWIRPAADDGELATSPWDPARAPVPMPGLLPRELDADGAVHAGVRAAVPRLDSDPTLLEATVSEPLS